MSEEIQNPSLVVPRSLMFSLVINGATGFAMLLTLLFCIGNFEDLQHSQTGFPFIDIYLKVTGSVGGTAAMTCIIVVLAGCATVGVIASTSRVIWAFARDRGLPASKYLSQVSEIIRLCHQIHELTQSPGQHQKLNSVILSDACHGCGERLGVHYRRIFYCIQRCHFSFCLWTLHVLSHCYKPASLPSMHVWFQNA